MSGEGCGGVMQVKVEDAGQGGGFKVEDAGGPQNKEDEEEPHEGIGEEEAEQETQ